MDETQVILNAFSLGPPAKRAHKVMHEIEPLPDGGDDAIMKMAKRQSQRERRRKKPLHKWTMTDFMHYLNSLLSVHSLHLERTAARDREVMASLHDRFVDQLQDKMDKTVLRNYLDWWVSCFAATMHDRKVYVNTVAQDFTVDKFLRRYRADIEGYVQEQGEPDIEQRVDEYALYELGGLSMLLMSRGVIVTHRVLREKGVDNVFLQISNALRDLSKEVVLNSMDITLKGAPYNIEDSVDFISLARPALKYYGISKYDRTRYQDCFQG